MPEKGLNLGLFFTAFRAIFWAANHLQLFEHAGVAQGIWLHRFKI